MERSLIQLSPSTAVVSLPAPWVRFNALKRGSTLKVDVIDNKVVVSADATAQKKAIVLDLRSLSRDLVWRYVDAAYIAGYDAITLRVKDREQRELIPVVVRYFPGLLIDEDRVDTVRLVDLSTQPQEELEKILSRVFNILGTMLDDIKTAMSMKDIEALLAVKKRDFLLNSYVSYYLRHINRFGYVPASKAGIVMTYIKLIEILADKVADLAVTLGKEKKSIDGSVVELIIVLVGTLRHIHEKPTQDGILALEQHAIRLKKAKCVSPIDAIILSIVGLIHDIEEVEIQLHI